MATVTLEFDAKNVAAKKLLDAILATGLFSKAKKSNGIDEAIEELQSGKTTTYKSFKDFKENVSK